MAKDIFYRPQLEHKKNYYTEGKVETASDFAPDVDEQSQGSLENKLDIIEDYVNKIDNLAAILPNSLCEAFLYPYLVTKDILSNLKNELPEVPPASGDQTGVKWPDSKPQVIPTPSEEESAPVGEVIAPADPFGEIIDPIVYVPVPDPGLTPEKEQEIKYADDLTDVIEDYVMNLYATVNSYVNNTITYCSMSKTETLNNITTKTMNDKNLSHITDYMTKSCIMLDQKLRLYKKMYTIDQSIFHYRSAKIANEQVKRYKKNKKVENTNLLNRFGNEILKESIVISEKKYEENLYSLYKYLNSSVIMLNECASATAKQKAALVLINNKERRK